MRIEVPTVLLGLALVAVVVVAWIALAVWVNRRFIDPWVQRKVREAEGDDR